jgi:hypothetical protein
MSLEIRAGAYFSSAYSFQEANQGDGMEFSQDLSDPTLPEPDAYAQCILPVPDKAYKNLYLPLQACLTQTSPLTNQIKRIKYEQIYRAIYQGKEKPIPASIQPLYFRLLHSYASEICYGQMGLEMDPKAGFKRSAKLMEISLKQQLIKYGYIREEAIAFSRSSLFEMAEQEPGYQAKELLHSFQYVSFCNHVGEDQSLRIMLGDTLALLSLSYQRIHEKWDFHIKLYDIIKKMFTFSYITPPYTQIFMRRKADFTYNAFPFILKYSFNIDPSYCDLVCNSQFGEALPLDAKIIIDANSMDLKLFNGYHDLLDTFYTPNTGNGFTQSEYLLKKAENLYNMGEILKRNPQLKSATSESYFRKALELLEKPQSGEPLRPAGWKAGWQCDFLECKIRCALIETFLDQTRIKKEKSAQEENLFSEVPEMAADSHANALEEFMKQSRDEGAQPIEFETLFKPVLKRYLT